MTAYLAGVQERLRATEVARASESARAGEAIVRARAERRARRLQVGLATSLLVLTTAGGLTFTYLLHQRQERAARFARVLAEAAALRDKAGRTPEDVSAWRDAMAALERAEGQGPEAEVADLRGAIRAGLEAAERDARLRQELVEARANQEEGRAAAAEAAYAAAFLAAGLDLDALGPDEVARRLGSRPAAARAAAGQGEREPPLDEPGRARWRKKALGWLKAHVARRAEQARAGTPEGRAMAVQRLGNIRRDPSFAGIRDAAALAALPADEQAACRALWADVDAAIARAGGGPP